MAEVKTMRLPFPVYIAAYPSGAKGLDVEETYGAYQLLVRHGVHPWRNLG